MTLLPSSITDADGGMGFDSDDAGAGVSKKPQHSNFQASPKICGSNCLGQLKNIWAESLALKLT